ncbi:hypothetical protein LZ30DRAFT_535600, partial [Colletotrichum cereale]
ISVVHVVNTQTLESINHYFDDWRKLNPEAAEFPKELVVTPSSLFWPSFERTPFYKAVEWTFDGTGKTVGSIHIIPKKGGFRGPPEWWFSGASVSYHLE